MKIFAIMFCVIMCGYTVAAEVYKWTDENGKVHFGDEKAAPNISKKLNVDGGEHPRNKSNFNNFATQMKPISRPIQSPNIPKFPDFNPNKKSVPVEASHVNPKCKGIVEQIEKVKAGTPWEDLASKYNQFCADIAYECNVYKRAPQNNKCMWVERSGTEAIIQKNTYE